MPARNMGYAQLTAAQCESFAIRYQREWHYLSYPPATRRAILARVERLVASNPNSYLARHWKAVYGAPTKGKNDDDTW